MEAEVPTVRVSATPTGLTSPLPPQPQGFLQAGCPSCHPTNSVKALKANMISLICLYFMFKSVITNLIMNCADKNFLYSVHSQILQKCRPFPTPRALLGMDYGPICSLVLRRTTSPPPKLWVIFFHYIRNSAGNYYKSQSQDYWSKKSAERSTLGCSYE